MLKPPFVNGGGCGQGHEMDEPSSRPLQDSVEDGAALRRQRLWPWFLAGFATVFVAISLTVTMYTMHPSGRALVPTPLWRHYIIELKRAVDPSTLGPATGGSSIVILIPLQHALCSLAGGGVVAATIWAARRLGARRRG